MGTDTLAQGVATFDGTVPFIHRACMLAPALAALSYPAWLGAFHKAMTAGETGGYLLAGVCLFAAFSVPILGIWIAKWVASAVPQSSIHFRARQVAFLSVCVPPLFILFGVGLGLLEAPIADTTLWMIVWVLAGLYVALGKSRPMPEPKHGFAAVRVAHGVLALLILCFVAFHLSNHLLGWLGPETHAAVMEWGRKFYRAPIIEPILIGLLLLQTLLGGVLVWRWSAVPVDGYRSFQVASGDYLAIFILAHLNSALVSARMVRGAETDWAWASGAPEGLLLDPWNVRLLPHYAFAVFFVLAHLFAGQRRILLAHGVSIQTATRVWTWGLVFAALISAAIIAALLGARL